MEPIVKSHCVEKDGGFTQRRIRSKDAKNSKVKIQKSKGEVPIVKSHCVEKDVGFNRPV